MKTPNMQKTLVTFCLLSLMVSGEHICLGQEKGRTGDDPLVDKVRIAIQNGVKYLKSRQQDRGGKQWNWENESAALSTLYPGGQSALAMLALLTSGVPANDPIIQRALPYLRDLPPTSVYVVSLQTIVLSEIAENRDLAMIQRNVDWLIQRRITRNGNLQGWTYKGGGETHADNSNTQYALLGLWAGRNAGAKIDRKIWEDIQQYYIENQEKSNKSARGWAYDERTSQVTSHTMTVAGVAGLYIAGIGLGTGNQKLDEKTGIARDCGNYDNEKAIRAGLNWLAKNYTFTNHAQARYYNIYGIERVGRLSGQRFFGDHDWYREGCEILTGVNPRYPELIQKNDGSWGGIGVIDNMTIVSTSFSMMFLAKGRTPILISKLAYDNSSRNPVGWNRKHNDARNLVEFASKELFKKTPLAWQVFDPRLPDLNRDVVFREELAGLLQTPILYLNGHENPDLSDRQIELLAKYVDEGGFIIAEACCGSEDFTKGFARLAKKMFPRSKLTPLSPDHPIWTANALIKPSEFPGLMGIERGCRTVLVFSPIPLAGFWEENRFQPEFGRPAVNRGQKAFRLASNIIAYATNLELPKPRLTKTKLSSDTQDGNLPRSVLRIAQIKTYGTERLATAAIHQLAEHLREKYRLDIALDLSAVDIGNRNLTNFKMLYMHGNKSFQVDDEDLANLRFSLQTGSVLLADACCGKKEFDDSFRQFIQKLFPKDKFPKAQLERIPIDDYLLSDKLNGQAIQRVKCRTENVENGKPPEEIAPYLEGIRINDRWVVIYSRYDLGCSIERSKSIACKGYQYEDALRIASAAVLYSLKR